MSDNLQPLCVLGCNDGQLRVLIDNVAGINQLGFLPLKRDLTGQRSLTQPCSYGKGNVVYRHRAGILTLRSIGQRNLNHIAS
jgi:hypothetical protein